MRESWLTTPAGLMLIAPRIKGWKIGLHHDSPASSTFHKRLPPSIRNTQNKIHAIVATLAFHSRNARSVPPARDPRGMLIKFPEVLERHIGRFRGSCSLPAAFRCRPGGNYCNLSLRSYGTFVSIHDRAILTPSSGAESQSDPGGLVATRRRSCGRLQSRREKLALPRTCRPVATHSRRLTRFV